MVDNALAQYQLAELMKDLGYRAVVQENSIKTGFSGLAVLVFYYPDLASLQLYCGFGNHVNENFGLDQANGFNERYRFTKCLIKQRTTVAFESDFFFDISDTNAQERLERVFNIWDVTLSAGVAELRQAQKT